MSEEEGPVAAPARPQVRVATSSGTVRITAERRDDVIVAADHDEQETRTPAVGSVEIQRSGKVEVRCPIGVDVVVGTRSGKVVLDGVLGDVRVTSQSGKIVVADAASVDARTTSSAIVINRSRGVCRVSTTSGSVEIDAAAEAEVRGVSGTVRVTAQTARVRTISGKVAIAADGDVSAETVSGGITVTLPAGVRPHVAISGMKRAKVEVTRGDDCQVRMRSVSGSMTVRSR
jgi:DUF4097 and DUF4098 domain-containing protein YvlB